MPKIESVDFYHPDITVFTLKSCLAVIEHYKLPPKAVCTVYFSHYKKKMTVGKLLYKIQIQQCGIELSNFSLLDYIFKSF